MSSAKRVSVLLLSLSILATAFATEAVAQEGARSVGKGIKCSQRFVPQPDGSLKLMQVCYKSI